MNKENQNTKLAQWLSGSLSEDEKKSLQKEYDLDLLQKELNKFENIDFPEFNTEEQYKKLLQKRNQKIVKSKRLFPAILKVAAVILLLLIPTWFVYNSLQKVTHSTNFAEQKTITLPDGSEVLMNAETEISYSEKHWEKERKINLEGEAFFKVSKGSVFTVVTSKGSVQVLGTQFNVYERSNIFKVLCVEGKVKVNTSASENILIKGRGVELRNGKLVLYEDEVEKPAWLSGKIKFRNAPLNEVFEELERRYNIKINSSEINIKRKFTGELPNNNLELALKILSKTMKLEYDFSEDKNLITFSLML